LIFRYAERPCKQKPPLWKHLAWNIVWPLKYPANKPLYMLCASAYTASDYAAYGCFKGKCYKWGYFPETRRYDDVDRLIAEKKPNSLLWVARFIDLKHPEVAVTVAKRLKEAGYIFELNMIGNGVLLDSMRELAEAKGVSDCLHLLGSMPPEAVREHMEKSEIFLFTSDRNEGWGAVLNESMNSACAVVADDAIGSVPFLVTEGENGLTYKTGDIETVVEKIKYLLDHPTERIQMAKKAYLTIVTEWNAENATEKLLILIDQIFKNEQTPFQTGVCSKAEVKINGK
jgi:glycosyltransferase involved in cell wall biosynthesis